MGAERRRRVFSFVVAFAAPFLQLSPSTPPPLVVVNHGVLPPLSLCVLLFVRPIHLDSTQSRLRLCLLSFLSVFSLRCCFSVGMVATGVVMDSSQCGAP